MKSVFSKFSCLGAGVALSLGSLPALCGAAPVSLGGGTIRFTGGILAESASLQVMPRTQATHPAPTTVATAATRSTLVWFPAASEGSKQSIHVHADGVAGTQVALQCNGDGHSARACHVGSDGGSVDVHASAGSGGQATTTAAAIMTVAYD